MSSSSKQSFTRFLHVKIDEGVFPFTVEQKDLAQLGLGACTWTELRECIEEFVSQNSTYAVTVMLGDFVRGQVQKRVKVDMLKHKL
jgi:hypothetical protein